jgi:hypothetical protein
MVEQFEMEKGMNWDVRSPIKNKWLEKYPLENLNVVRGFNLQERGWRT